MKRCRCGQVKAANQDGGAPRVYLQQETGTPLGLERRGQVGARKGIQRALQEPEAWEQGPWWEMACVKVYKAGREQRSGTLTSLLHPSAPASFRGLPQVNPSPTPFGPRLLQGPPLGEPHEQHMQRRRVRRSGMQLAALWGRSRKCLGERSMGWQAVLWAVRRSGGRVTKSQASGFRCCGNHWSAGKEGLTCFNTHVLVFLSPSPWMGSQGLS